jgi:hypothetical protein
MGAVFALAMGSCAYDPNYAVGGSYSTGYGGGYGDGYGNSGFSTSLFISTGDPRWGYDPYCYSYYDYRRRCYYDPYLYGYYPVGYRPPVIYGVPHPRGYSRSYCPPPSRVTNITLANYHNRENSYRNSTYSWARQVRPDSGATHGATQIQQQAPYSRSGGATYPGNRNVAPAPGSPPRTRNGNTSNFEGGGGAVNRPPRLPSIYNVPINTSKPAGSSQATNERRTRSDQVQGVSEMESNRPMPQTRAKHQTPPPTHQVRGPQQPSAPQSSAPAPDARGRDEGKEGKEGKGRKNR